MQKPVRWFARSFHNTDAVVLMYTDTGVSDRDVWFFTADSGLLMCRASAARRPKKSWGGMFVPLTQGKLTYKVSASFPDRGRLISFDITWSPAAHREVTPEYLLFLSFCAEIGRLFLPMGEKEPKIFRVVTEIARLSAASVPLRGLATLWLWIVLSSHGFLGMQTDCPGCGGSVDALQTGGIWDNHGDLWHAGCLNPNAEDKKGVFLSPQWAHILARASDSSNALEHSAKVIARFPSLYRHFVQRAEEVLGYPFRTLEVARLFQGGNRIQ